MKTNDELDNLTDSIDDAILQTENLLNQYEPGSIEYSKYSRCLGNLREALNELIKQNGNVGNDK